MIWYYFLMGITLLVLGLVIHRFKAYFLISGYNMYTKEQKEKVDIEAIGKLFGLFGYSNGIIFLGCALLEAFGVSVPIGPSLVFMIVSTVALVFMSQKYDFSRKDEEGKLNKKGKNELKLTLGILVLTGIFMGSVFYFSVSTPKVVVNEEGVELKGIYGDLYLWESIENIELKEELPTITLRNNGSSLAGHLKGRFKTKEYGNVTLFVEKNIPVYIYMTRNSRVTIVNLTSEEKTLELYQDMENSK